MFNIIELEEKQKRIIEALKKAVDTEQAIALCFTYISKLVENGRIRVKFSFFAEESEKNKNLLLQSLEELGDAGFLSQDKCLSCRLTPQSFSLFGALNLGLEITGIAIGIYNELVSAYKGSEEEIFFRRLLSGKKALRNFLKREKNFVEVKSQPDFMMNFCIPHIAGKLAK